MFNLVATIERYGCSNSLLDIYSENKNVLEKIGEYISNLKSLKCVGNTLNVVVLEVDISSHNLDLVNTIADIQVVIAVDIDIANQTYSIDYVSLIELQASLSYHNSRVEKPHLDVEHYKLVLLLPQLNHLDELVNEVIMDNALYGVNLGLPVNTILEIMNTTLEGSVLGV